MRKYSQIAIFGIAALLVALPMTSSNVFAQVATGTADLEASCGISVPDGIDLGTLRAGNPGIEGLLTIGTEGTITSTLEVTANDWTGTDGKVHLQSEVTKYAIIVDDTVYVTTDYSAKTSLDESGEIKELASEISPEFSVQLYLQISAEGNNLENMPYSGALTQTLTFVSDCAVV